MARPKSKDKELTLLEAVTTASVQSGVATFTAAIVRNVGVAEGMLFRYFATKDDLINELHLFLEYNLCQSMMTNLDRLVTDAKTMTYYIWNSYISWGLNHTCGHRTTRQLAVSEKMSKEAGQQADDMFPKPCDLRHRSVRPEFISDGHRAFGDGLLLSLAEITMEFAARGATRANEYTSTGFEAVWRALTREEQ